VHAVAQSAADQLDGANVRHTVHVGRGRPVDELLADLSRTRPDLVVMGTRGLSTFKRLHIGSTARSIAHQSRFSMLLACAPQPDTEVTP
jgi:nucleotide-binding universal stress UspA family protein